MSLEIVETTAERTFEIRLSGDELENLRLYFNMTTVPRGGCNEDRRRELNRFGWQLFHLTTNALRSK